VALRRLIEKWPHHPYRWASDRAAVTDLVVERLERSLRRPDVRAWCMGETGEPQALATLEALEWDTRVLGLGAGRLKLFVTGHYAEACELAGRLCAVAESAAREWGLEHISARVDAADDPSIHALESAAFLNVDALATFSASSETLAAIPRASDLPVSAATAHDCPNLTALAGSFVHGRFHTDPSIAPERAGDIYRAWIEACCARTAADEVIVARDGHDIAGFIACRVVADTARPLGRPAGTIPLVAVGAAWQGQRVGSRLLAAAGEWFVGRRVSMVEIGTQLRNISAARLYGRSGFRITSGSLSFRKIVRR
jgi:dTDP-4-amino-4,6-dideoxy-D-galactose acyltransferase